MSTHQNSKTPNTLASYSHEPQNQENPQSLIQVATNMVDSVTDMLCKQITDGSISINEYESPLNISMVERQPKEAKTIDLDEHRRKIRKFMKMNKKYRKNREQRSLEVSDRKQREYQEKKKEAQQSKVKALEERRRSIEQRMNEKKMMMKQIQKNSLESSQRVSSIRKKKFLYQQKQQQFYNNVLLPKLEHEKSILEKKKELRKPIDMTQLFQHQKQYQQLKISSQLNRSITARMVAEIAYEPPSYVPQSFKKLQMEEQLQKHQKVIKERQSEINQLRKKQFIRQIDELREHERELSLSLSKSPKNQKEEKKERAKPKLERQQIKNVGNNYLKQLIAVNRKFATTKKLKPLTKIQPEKRKIRSQYEIEIVKEERVEKVKKIRNKKIDQIINDKQMSEHEKHQKLKYEIEKLDRAADQKFHENTSVETINQSAVIMMSSIHAKLGLLGMGPH